MSSSALGPSATNSSQAARAYDKKMDAMEDRKLDKIAAEAQAFLLNNQKQAAVSDVGSVSSISKGTIGGADSVAHTVKSAKKGTKKGAKKGVDAFLPTGGTSFSKAGKTFATKNMI